MSLEQAAPDQHEWDTLWNHNGRKGGGGMTRRPGRVLIAIGLLSAIACTVPASAVASAAPSLATPGYWLVGSDGGVFSFNSGFYGSAVGHCLTTLAGSSTACAAAITSSPSGRGYFLTAPWATTTPNAFGDASVSGERCLNPNDAGGWIGLALSATGQGFLLANAFGNVIVCGDATSYGDPTNLPGVRWATVGIAATPDRKGYWLFTYDGGVFAYGDATFYGSMGSQHLSQPIVGGSPTSDGRGYWLVSTDGGVFSFGDATFAGSMGGKHLSAPMVGIAADPHGVGYWTVASDGGVFSFGGAPFEGSMGGKELSAPIVGIAASPN
jgi:hypothetical protein